MGKRGGVDLVKAISFFFVIRGELKSWLSRRISALLVLNNWFIKIIAICFELFLLAIICVLLVNFYFNFLRSSSPTSRFC